MHILSFPLSLSPSPSMCVCVCVFGLKIIFIVYVREYNQVHTL